MKYNKIPNTDLEISCMTLGTWVFGGDMWGGTSESACTEAILTAIDCGINTIDTAPAYGYGSSEEIIGKALKGKRDKVIIATKCGLVWHGKVISIDLSPASVQKEIDASLKRLQTDYIDIYQCHWPDPKTPIEKTMQALIEIKKAGKIKHIGVSNFDEDLITRCLSMTPIVTLQSPFSLLNHKIEEDVLPFATQKRIGVLSYGVLGGGILSGKYPEEKKFKSSDARHFFYKYYSGTAFDRTRLLLEVLRKFSRPLNQVAINWVRQQTGIASVIVGCRNEIQVKQNAASTSWDLTDEQLYRIRMAISKPYGR